MSLRNFTPSPETLRCEAAAHSVLRERLLTAMPELDEETLSDTLEGLTSLHELLAAVVRSALTDEAMINGLKGRIAEMKARLDRLTARAERKRDLAQEAMAKAAICKLSAPDFSATLRQGGPVLEIGPEADIPAAFLKPQEPKLDKIALLGAVKNGVVVTGVSLAAPRMQLSVRSK